MTSSSNKSVNTININEAIKTKNSNKIQSDILPFFLSAKFLNLFIQIKKVQQRINSKIIINKEKEKTNTIVLYFHKEDKILLSYYVIS